MSSLDFVESVPKPTKQEAIQVMKELLASLPKQQDYSQEDVNRSIKRNSVAPK